MIVPEISKDDPFSLALEEVKPFWSILFLVIPSKYYGFNFHGFLSSFHLNAFLEKL